MKEWNELHEFFSHFTYHSACDINSITNYNNQRCMYDINPKHLISKYFYLADYN